MDTPRKWPGTLLKKGPVTGDVIRHNINAASPWCCGYILSIVFINEEIIAYNVGDIFRKKFQNYTTNMSPWDFAEHYHDLSTQCFGQQAIGEHFYVKPKLFNRLHAGLICGNVKYIFLFYH